MWTSVCACLTAPRRVPQPAAAARPHSSHDKTAAAGREKWAFDPESVGQARAARTRRADVARWATDALPAAVEREACGVVFREANGSACVVFAFESGANVVVDLPETTRGAVYRAVLKHADALLAARAGAPPPPLSAPRRDDACLAALLSACCVVCVRRAGREAAAAAFLAAGVALLAYASGAAAARAAAGRRRRGGRSRPSTAATRKRGAVTLLGHKALRGCPCCDFSIDGGDLFG